jgi:endonuclease-3
LEKHNTKINQIISLLQKEYPNTRTALTFSNPLELLVAVILSAQCTDALVNKITPALFARFRTASEYANADINELETLIYSSGFYRNKAKNIQGAARLIAENFGGSVPDNMKDMLTLPGVARKTANVVLYNAFGKREGIAVDTHVKRLSRLLGLTEETNPDRIEKDLMTFVPLEYWGDITHLLIDHGRKVCIARRPQCSKCVLAPLCPSAIVID